MTLPPELRTSAPGSFAMRTIVERKPRIIAQVLETNELCAEQRRRVDALRREIADGVVTSPLEGDLVPDGALVEEERRSWQRQIARWEGRGWLDVPWFFAEAFFYLKILAAVGYFRGEAPDPFRALKERELRGAHGGLDRAATLIRAVAAAPAEGVALLMGASLWGNRIDLSNSAVDDGSRAGMLADDRANLLVDHCDAAVAALGRASRVEVILDNVGPELVADLLLADQVGRLNSSARVTLHAKRLPFFVSDSTAEDVLRTVDALAGAADPAVSAVGRRLRDAIAAGRIRVRDHWLWSSAEHYTDLPPDLRGELDGADLVVVKGDANYRRILADRSWEPWRSLDDLAGSFPRPFLCLRTLKSDIIVDVLRAEALRLDRDEPDWRVSGRRGIVRLCS